MPEASSTGHACLKMSMASGLGRKPGLPEDHSWGYDEREALNSVLGGYGRFYKMVVDAGHKPNDSWLVLNTKFKWW